MFDEFIYRLCDKIVTICESIQSRIKSTKDKDWIKGYRKWKSHINKNDTE
jgi:hypothetical protein